MTLRISVGLSLMLGTAVLAAQERPRNWTATHDTVDGVPRVTSPGYTEWRDTTFGWRLALEQTVDIRGADSGSWNPQWRVHLLDNGSVVVFRPAPQGFELYDSRGRFVRSIGRQGDGREEYRNASAFTVKGDTLVVNDGRAGRVVLYTLRGRFVRSFETGIRGEGTPIQVDPRGHIRIQQNFGAPHDSVMIHWVYFNLRGARVDSISRPHEPQPPSWEMRIGTRYMRFMVPFAPVPKAAFLSDGSLVYGNTGSWDFVQGREGRDSALIFRRENVPLVPISPGYADSVFAEATDRPELRGVARRDEMPTNYPAWNDLVADGAGNLWVDTGYRRLRNHYWAVFGSDGRYRGPVPAWFEFLSMSSWGRDQVAYLGWVDKGRPVIRLYRVVKPE